VQQDAGQKQDVIDQRGRLEIAAEQPADFENVLVQPALATAEKQKQQPEAERKGEKIQFAQL